MREEHQLQCLQHSTLHNLSETSYYNPLMEATWSYIPPFQHQCFSFPIDINLWLTRRKLWSVTHSNQHKYWNILLFDFHCHSTHIKFSKIQQVPINTTTNIFFSISQTFTNMTVWTFCFLFVNIIVKFFPCLLVWFATLCFVLSLATILLFITSSSQNISPHEVSTVLVQGCK